MRALSARNADTAYAVSVGTGAALDGARLVRIMLDGIDMTGTDIRRAEALGYAVSEREAVLAQSHAQEMTLSEVRHCAVSAVLSLTGALAFVRIYRSASRPHNSANGQTLARAEEKARQRDRSDAN